VGSGGLRDYVVGQEDRAATADEMAKMKALVADAMAQGALGLSSSLQYVPNRFSTTDELVELAKVAAAHGGIYITHQRSEGNKVFESIDEVLAIAERADIPTEIWHLKTAYKANWGKMTEVLRRIDAARARGLRVSADIYPYDRASNGLDACLPVWVREGGTDAMLTRLRDPGTRARVKRDMDDANAPFENQWFGSGGPAGAIAGRSPNGRSVSGTRSAVSDPEIPEVMSRAPTPMLLRKTLATVLLPATSGTLLSRSCVT
jgi:N-acyl-D-aspartate/D-glutamate deacylase